MTVAVALHLKDLSRVRSFETK